MRKLLAIAISVLAVASTAVVPASRGEALRALAPSTLLQLHVGEQQVLSDLTALVGRLPAYQLHLGPDVDRIGAVTTNGYLLEQSESAGMRERLRNTLAEQLLMGDADTAWLTLKDFETPQASPAATQDRVQALLTLHKALAGIFPGGEPSGERLHVGVAHLLQSAPGQGRAIAAGAIQQDRLGFVTHRILDVEIQNGVHRNLGRARLVYRLVAVCHAIIPKR